MSENTVYTDDFDKSIYNLRWYQLPSDEKLLNKHVVFQVDKNYTDSVNTEMVNKIQSAYSNTYGSGVNPEAVPDLLEALKFVRESPQFKRMDWKLKVTIDAAIAKAKLI